MTGKFYIYVLFRPWDGSPCYVGKGKGQRAFDHAKKAAKHPNRRLAKIIVEAGGEIPAVIVQSGLDEDTALRYEREFIAAIGRGKHGPLVNATAGGQGTAGHRHSAKTKRLMSAQRIGKKKPSLQGKPSWNKGMVWSEKDRQQNQLYWTEERRAEASEYWKKRGLSIPIEGCRKGGHATKGIKTGPNKARGVPKTPDHRAAISASRKDKPHPHKGVPRSPECRAKISETKRLKRLAAMAALAA